MPVPFIFTPTAITVVIDGRTQVVPASSPNFNDLKVALRKNAEEPEIKKILNIKSYVAQLSEGRADIVDGSLYFDGAPLAGVLAERVAQMFAEGLGVLPLLRFLNRVAQNPRKDIAQELYPFLESGRLPITEDGFILAYKMVRPDFKDVYSGTMDNSPGKVVSLASYEVVDSNRYNECSVGLHFCSLAYIEAGLASFVAPGNRLLQLLIDPVDIVAIPTDFNRSKGRAWKYTVLRELDWNERIKANFASNAYVNGEVAEDEELEDDAELDEDVDSEYDNSDDNQGPVANKAPAGSKLDEDDVLEILKLLDDDSNTLTAIGKLYDISPRQVARIRDGEAWGWVSDAYYSATHNYCR